MPESERPRSLADTAPAVAPRMMSGQFPDEILDPAIREIEQQYGVVPDRDALRARLEQEIGFADYGKYAREQFLEGLRLIVPQDDSPLTGTRRCGMLIPIRPMNHTALETRGRVADALRRWVRISLEAKLNEPK